MVSVSFAFPRTLSSISVHCFDRCWRVRFKMIPTPYNNLCMNRITETPVVQISFWVLKATTKARLCPRLCLSSGILLFPPTRLEGNDGVRNFSVRATKVVRKSPLRIGDKNNVCRSAQSAHENAVSANSNASLYQEGEVDTPECVTNRKRHGDRRVTGKARKGTVGWYGP